MRTRRFVILCLTLTTSMVVPATVSSFEGDPTHSSIAGNAIATARLVDSRAADLLITGKVLSVKDLLGTGNQRIFGDYKELVRRGSINEDYYPTQANTATHFHDPVTNQGASLPIFPPSAMDRAIGRDPLYGWDWVNAREFFRLGLTSVTKAERDENLGKAFYSLGRIAHLLQDMAVPAHVRNDLHFVIYMPPFYVNKDLFERFWQNSSTLPSAQGDPLSFSLLSDFWDGDLANVDYLNPDRGNGLAEFTNRHFLSQDTNFDDGTLFFYPNRWEPACESYTMVEAPRGEAIEVDYYRCTYPDHTDNRTFTIQHMTANSIFDFELGRKTLLRERVFSLNNRCFEDYGNILIPKAIRYTAGLFDYFFRGSFEAPAGRALVESKFADVISLHLRNASGETMSNGTLYLYQDDGDENAPGAENRLRGNPVTAQIASWPAGETYQGNEFSDVWVWLPNGKKLEDITFTLIFVGRLGNEDNAVVARRFHAPAPPASIGRHVYDVGSNPMGLAVTPDGSRVLVTNYSDDTVSVLDARGTETLATISVGDGPYDIAIAGGYAFVSNERGGSISVINLENYSVTTPFTGLPAYPREIAATSDGTSVYCAHWSASYRTLSKINVATMALTLLNDNLDFRMMMTGIALHPTEPKGYALYYAYFWRKSVAVFNTSTDTKNVDVPGPDLNRSGAVEAGGSTLYYVSGFLDQVSRLDTITNAHVLPAIALDSGANPRRVSAGSDGKVYVTLYGGNKVQVINGATGAKETPISDADLSSPMEAVASPDNTVLYVSSSGNNKVLRIPLQTQGPSTFSMAAAFSVMATQSPAPTSALTLSGVPYEADIRFDERYAPQEAYGDGAHLLSSLPTGWHTLEIVTPGYRPWLQQVLLLEGENLLTPVLETE